MSGGSDAGALLLGLIFNVLNFENGLGWTSLSAYWQSVVRGEPRDPSDLVLKSGRSCNWRRCLLGPASWAVSGGYSCPKTCESRSSRP
jgi:hypothetical protein